MQVVMALDQGTTSSRAVLFDHQGMIVGVAQREFKQIYPQPGWVEHDADEIWQSQLSVARDVLDKTNSSAHDVAALGIANQRETVVVWERATGRPIANAIVWQDRRTAAECDRLREAGHSELIQSRTGLLLDAYFCATKIRWLLDNVPGAGEKAVRGELAFGTVDSWLVWNLTGGRIHATDVTNASRTMLLQIQTCQWDDDLLALFDIPKSMMPEVLPSSHGYGETDSDLLGGPIKIGGAAGDQQSALFGQNCTEHGMAKNTYGTGCFLLMNIGDVPVPSKCNLLTTVACSLEQSREYALEGSVFIAGAAVQWLRDELGVIKTAAEVEDLARTVSDSGGVYLVPAFAGLGARTLGRLRAGRHSGNHAWYDTSSSGSSRFGRHRVPGGRRAGRYETGFLDGADGTSRRWWGFRQRPADAISGRYLAGSGDSPPGHRNHGLGRGLSGRFGRWFLGQHESDRPDLAGGSGL